MIIECGEITWFEVEDGEHFQLEQIDEDGEITDTILMTREIALQLAKEIFETLSFNEDKS